MDTIYFLIVSISLVTLINGEQPDPSCLQCICQASSNCDTVNLKCLSGSRFDSYCGPYQISRYYWEDGNGIGYDFETCTNLKACAERVIINYMKKYSRDCNGDGVIDCLDYAAIHRMGFEGCSDQSLYSSEYWQVFSQTQCVINPSLEASPQLPSVYSNQQHDQRSIQNIYVPKSYPDKNPVNFSPISSLSQPLPVSSSSSPSSTRRLKKKIKKKNQRGSSSRRRNNRNRNRNPNPSSNNYPVPIDEPDPLSVRSRENSPSNRRVDIEKIPDSDSGFGVSRSPSIPSYYIPSTNSPTFVSIPTRAGEEGYINDEHSISVPKPQSPRSSTPRTISSYPSSLNPSLTSSYVPSSSVPSSSPDSFEIPSSPPSVPSRSSRPSTRPTSRSHRTTLRPIQPSYPPSIASPENSSPLLSPSYEPEDNRPSNPPPISTYDPPSYVQPDPSPYSPLYPPYFEPSNPPPYQPSYPSSYEPLPNPYSPVEPLPLTISSLPPSPAIPPTTRSPNSSRRKPPTPRRTTGTRNRSSTSQPTTPTRPPVIIYETQPTASPTSPRSQVRPISTTVSYYQPETVRPSVQPTIRPSEQPTRGTRNGRRRPTEAPTTTTVTNIIYPSSSPRTITQPSVPTTLPTETPVNNNPRVPTTRDTEPAENTNPLVPSTPRVITTRENPNNDERSTEGSINLSPAPTLEFRSDFDSSSDDDSILPSDPRPPHLSNKTITISDQCLSCLCESTESCSNKGTCSNPEGPCGPLQVTYGQWVIAGKPKSNFQKCASSLDCSRRILRNFYAKHGIDCNLDSDVNCVDFALIHKYGLDNCKVIPDDLFKSNYWLNFENCYGFDRR